MSFNGYVFSLILDGYSFINFEDVFEEDVRFPIDFRDAYLQISICPNSLLYLRNALDGRGNQCKVLCFELSTVSQVFTRVLFLVSAWAHKREMYLLLYLDN